MSQPKCSICGLGDRFTVKLGEKFCRRATRPDEPCVYADEVAQRESALGEALQNLEPIHSTVQDVPDDSFPIQNLEPILEPPLSPAHRAVLERIFNETRDPEKSMPFPALDDDGGFDGSDEDLANMIYYGATTDDDLAAILHGIRLGRRLALYEDAVMMGEFVK